MSTVAYAHIEFTEDGTPIVSGTRTKVEEIVLDHIAHHWDAVDIHRQHPHLSLAQIHSSLAYYYDHRTEVEDAIAAGLLQVEAIRGSLGSSSIREKLHARGLLP